MKDLVRDWSLVKLGGPTSNKKKFYVRGHSEQVVPRFGNITMNRGN
jgi:hypothetical protein